MKFLLDTCVISDFFKKDLITINHLQKVSQNDVSISAITVMEIEYGLKLNEVRAAKIIPLWQKLLEEIYVFSFQEEEAVSTSLLRSHLRRQIIGAYDVMIAGTALTHNLCLVTSNMREFGRLDQFIRIENWRT